MARTFVADSGNTARLLGSRLPMADSGGTTRFIQRILISDASNVTRTVYQAFTGATHTYNTAGTSTDTIPSGAASVTIECWGSSGSGGTGLGSGCVSAGGGGGGSGGYAKTILSLTSSNWGQTMTVVVGAINSGSSVTSGSFSILTTMLGGGGLNGNNASSSTVPGTGGGSGTTTGGNTLNTTGHNGSNGITGPGSGGGGGAAIIGTNGTGPAGGRGANNAAGTGRTFGAVGLVIIKYT